jgi:hypothetical protein
MPDTAVVNKKDSAPPPPAPAKGSLTVIDLGEHSRKRIKKLRRGEGRLMEKIEDTLSDLEEQGVIEASAQTVVIVVREEPSLGSIFGGDD